MTQVNTIFSEKLNRNLIVCKGCEKGIKGNAYSSYTGFKCEKCEFARVDASKLPLDKNKTKK